jgi:hypothetical protein
VLFSNDIISEVKQQVIDFLLSHGGTDKENINFIFHFQTYQGLVRARYAQIYP